jgi:hypothetical protein
MVASRVPHPGPAAAMNPYTAVATALMLLLTLVPLSHSKVW